MALYRPRYHVEYDPTQPPLEVVIGTGDMMRAELEAHRLKLAPNLNFHTTALWLWSALERMGEETRKAGEFLADPPEWEPVKGADGQPELTQVDPTQGGSGETDSDAQLSTVTPDSGLTPTYPNPY
jgi:hypothetical protein